MTTRERWTVYPLLFLAIGLAMRAVLVPPAEFDTGRIRCREIMVIDEEGTVLVHLGRVSAGKVDEEGVAAGGGGRIEINSRRGDSLLSIGSLPNDPRPVIEFAGPGGEVVRTLTPSGDETPAARP